MDPSQTIRVDGVRWGSAAMDAGAERRRAHAKHSAKGQSAEQMPWTDPFWLPMLVEEVGEVARAICDREPAARVREELIQVAAMALAWADAVEEFVQNSLNCPVCGSGEEGDCICAEAEAIAKAHWEEGGRAVYEAPWEQVSPIKRHSLIVKALAEVRPRKAGA